MQLLDDLRREHDLIEPMLGSLRAFVTARLEGRGLAADGARYLAFFRRFAGDFHHDKEEAVLFKALVEQAELPGDRGPIAAITGEHRRMADLLDALGGVLGSDLADADDRTKLHTLAVDYSHALWRHMDAENSVLFPEGEERLRRAHVRELPSRPMHPAEQAAFEDAPALLAAYPPQADPQAPRGDGCVNCASYGTTCDGLEAEWWSDLEWEDHWDRMQSD